MSALKKIARNMRVFDVKAPCAPWACDRCASTVFIPIAAKAKGGVCTQQAKGCQGKLVKLDGESAALVRAKLVEIGMAEQPWLTLVFGSKPS